MVKKDTILNRVFKDDTFVAKGRDAEEALAEAEEKGFAAFEAIDKYKGITYIRYSKKKDFNPRKGDKALLVTKKGKKILTLSNTYFDEFKDFYKYAGYCIACGLKAMPITKPCIKQVRFCPRCGIPMRIEHGHEGYQGYHNSDAEFNFYEEWKKYNRTEKPKTVNANYFNFFKKWINKYVLKGKYIS